MSLSAGLLSSCASKTPAASVPLDAIGPSVARHTAKPSSHMGSTLDQLARTGRDRGAAAARELARSRGLEMVGDRVKVELKAAPGRTSAVRDAVVRAGGEVLAGYREWMVALLPLDGLAAVAGTPGVMRLDRPIVPVPDVTSEGVAETQADGWQTAGWDGTGVKVGIIDGGFMGYPTLLGSELPTSVTAWGGGSAGSENGGTAHGTGVAEVVHDEAPGASLYLARINSMTDLGNAKDWMKSQGVQVINHSMGWFLSEPGNGTGPVNAVVDDAVGSGIVWANSAGNERKRHWRGDYTDPDSDGDLDWDGAGDVNTIVTTSPRWIYAYLDWQDSWGNASQDYDLVLLRWNGSAWTYVTGSYNNQDGSAGSEPIEWIQYYANTAGTYGLGITRWSATATSVDFNLHTPVTDLDNAANPNGHYFDHDHSLTVPSDNGGSGFMSVAALGRSPGFAQEDYSSEGPTRDGRTAPDIAGPSSVTNFVYGNFAGTSASSPHVAGAAALVRQLYPEYGPAQVESFLRSGAIDTGAVGADDLYGAGRLWLPMDTTAPVGTVVIDSGASHTATTAVTLELGATDAGTGAREMQVSNDGVFDTEPWETTATTKAWDLPAGDGVKTVHVRYRDRWPNVSAVCTDAIVLDTTGPTGSVTIDGGAARAATAAVALTLSASDTDSVVTSMAVSNDGVFDTEPWEPYSVSKPWDLGGADGTRTVYVLFEDAAGNVSPVRTDTILLDSTPPAVTGDGWAVSEDASLSVAAPGVLANDTDLCATTATVSAGPAHGTLALSPDGAFTYEPVADFNGTDTFGYRASDGVYWSDPATVTITVTPMNDAPVARDDPGFEEIVKLLPPDADNGGWAGYSAAISGDTAVIGAPRYQDYKGRAYVYRRSGSDWTLEGVLAASDGFSGDCFGCAVAISGDTVIVGAYSDDGMMGVDAGAAYVFTRSGSAWTQAAKLRPPEYAAFTGFGSSVAISGSTVLVGSWYVGEAYLLTGGGASWTHAAHFVTTGGTPGPLIGGTWVAVSEDRAVVGDDGAVHVFARSGTTWTPEAQLTAPGTEVFGTLVALSGDSIAVGAPWDDDLGWQSGAVHVFTSSGATWTQQVKLFASDGSPADQFGRSPALAGDTLVVGAVDDSEYKGFAYVFSRSGSTWSQRAKLGDGAPGDMFGVSAAISGTTILVGASLDSDAGGWSGAAHVFDGQPALETPEDTPLPVPARGVLANDTDVDGDPLTATQGSDPAHGTATLAEDGSFTYTPDADWSGVDTFTYRASDGTATSDPATVTITVTPVNDPPVAVDDTATCAEDTYANLDVLPNDTDVEGDGLTASLETTPAHGTVALDPSGQATYTPEPDFNGTDTFTYRASDGTATSDPATVTITVTNVDGTVTRIPGPTRYDVAVNMARKGWYEENESAPNTWTGLTHVVVACGATGKESDPLAAAGLAGVFDAPILLVPADGTVPAGVYATIRDIASANASIAVHIVGGTASVPTIAQRRIDNIAGVNRVTRDGGADRYVVTANVSKHMRSVAGTDAIAGVLVMCSEKPAAFFDALAASPIAFARHMPLIGVKAGFVPYQVRAELRALRDAGKDRWVVSSPAYISKTVASSPLVAARGRLATSYYRFAAAIQIANAALVAPWLDCADTGVTAKLPDALGGGAFMGHKGGVLLYTTSYSAMQPATRDWIDARHNSIQRGWVFGGTASVSLAQQMQFAGLLR